MPWAELSLQDTMWLHPLQNVHNLWCGSSKESYALGWEDIIIASRPSIKGLSVNASMDCGTSWGLVEMKVDHWWLTTLGWNTIVDFSLMLQALLSASTMMWCYHWILPKQSSIHASTPQTILCRPCMWRNIPSVLFITYHITTLALMNRHCDMLTDCTLKSILIELFIMMSINQMALSHDKISD